MEDLKTLFEEQLKILDNMIDTLSKSESDGNLNQISSRKYSDFLELIATKEKTDGFTTWNKENYEETSTDENDLDADNDSNIINYNGE